MEGREEELRSSVDSSRPFSSVKEAVAIFGERLLVGEIYSPKPLKSESPMKNDGQVGVGVDDAIKKLEAELQQTKAELKLLKERGSETEVALATLNAELHKNMSKFARAEAEAAAAATKTVRFQISQPQTDKDSHILSLGENDHLFGGKKLKKHKHKPIIPLVGDFFFKRKPSSATNHHNPLYASPF